MNTLSQQIIADIATTAVQTIGAAVPIGQAIDLLAAKRLSCLLVVDDGKPVGILTERDLLRLFAEGYDEAEPVRAVMSFPLITVRKDLDFVSAQLILGNRGVRHLVLIDDAGELYGVVTETDFRRHISVDLYKAIQHLGIVMDVAEELVAPDQPLAAVLSAMATLRLDHTLVGRNGIAEGIITERDVPRLLAARQDLINTPIGEVMSKPLQTISIKASVAEAAKRLTETGLRHLVVTNEAGRFAGIVSQHRLLERLSAVILENGHNRLAPRASMSEQHFDEFVEHLQLPLAHLSADGRLIYVNRRFVEDFGYTLNDVPSFAAWCKRAYPDAAYRKSAATGWQAAIAEAQRQGRPMASLEHRVLCGDGAERILEIGGIPLGNAFLATFVDVTAHRQAEAQLRQAASVFEHANEGIMITDAKGIIVDVNAAFTRITGYERTEVLGRNPSLLNSGKQGPEFFNAMWHALRETGQWTCEIWNRRKNGEVFAEMQTISAIKDGSGTVQRYVSLFSDITALKEHQQQLEHIAHFDALTSLPNRVLLGDRLQQAITQAERRKTQVAVIYLDLDGFKAVNDTYGHAAGDKLLVTVAARMKQALREGDTLARLGGDEFVAVLLDLESRDSCEPVLQRLLTAASDVVNLGLAELAVSASIGVSFFPQTEEVDADLLLRQADQAMYQAKQAGKNRCHLFDAEHDRALRGRHESIERIREGLEGREFELYYQPKVNLRDGQVIGAEALIRWRHPEHGLLSPTLFLPLIEDHELSVLIGDWVIETALAQLEEWQAQGLALPVSVNIGSRQLQAPEFLAKLQVALHLHPRAAGLLELEVLESSALGDIGEVSRLIQACRDLGVHFALDDFGTGYSSLTYLKRLPAQTLKIDQSFVRDMLEDPEDLAILDGIIGLAESFQRQAIAEGVETREHGEMLLRLGCELAQGYGIARPMPADDLTTWVAEWQHEGLWRKCRRARREDQAVLFAMTEHRAWVRTLERSLHEAHSATPPPDHHQCRFGHWLEQTGKRRFADHPRLPRVLALHEAIHERATAMLTAKHEGRATAAREAFHAVEGMRDELLALLEQLIEEAPEE